MGIKLKGRVGFLHRLAGGRLGVTAGRVDRRLKLALLEGG